MDVLRTICDTVTPQPGHDATTWATALDKAVDRVLGSCIDLDPETDRTVRRSCDGRSLYIEPITNQSTSEHVLAQEEHILTWALDAQAGDPIPSHTVADDALDDGQHDAASAVAGHDRLVLVVGPAGAGKTRMLQAAVTDLHAQTRSVIGFAPTAKAARVLETGTGMPADTVAKLLYELDHPDPNRQPWFDAGPGTTVIVDEAGMLNTADLHRLVVHAEQHQWRLALVGDPHQLQAVGRGGMFQELCTTGRTIELEHLHRFTNEWEATNSLRLRQGDPDALHFYNTFDRIRAGTFDDHLDTITAAWTQCRDDGVTISITTCRNEHVHAINHHIQQRRVEAGELDQDTLTPIADGWAMVGDIVATRRNDRRLRTSAGEPVRNRERWTITDTNPNGDLTVTRLDGHGTITLPADYVRVHVQLAYATTEHGAQGDTADRSITLATTATTGRGLYVGMTRGRDENHALVVTDTPDVAEAISILEAAIAIDRADIPATTHRRTLAEVVPRSGPRPRVQIPEWFDELRATAEEKRRAAQQALTDRNAERAAGGRRVAEASHDLPAAEAAHAPFNEKVVAAKRVVGESQSALWNAEFELRKSGRVHRHSARREVEVATDILAVADDRLTRAEELAVPTRAPLDDLRKIIDDHRQFDSNGSTGQTVAMPGQQTWSRSLPSLRITMNFPERIGSANHLLDGRTLKESRSNGGGRSCRRSKWVSSSEPACSGRASGSSFRRCCLANRSVLVRDYRSGAGSRTTDRKSRTARLGRPLTMSVMNAPSRPSSSPRPVPSQRSRRTPSSRSPLPTPSSGGLEPTRNRGSDPAGNGRAEDTADCRDRPLG
ncbi:MAG: ATP-dependent DNA helicase [Acidimicrobiales bacterium]